MNRGGDIALIGLGAVGGFVGMLWGYLAVLSTLFDGHEVTVDTVLDVLFYASNPAAQIGLNIGPAEFWGLFILIIVLGVAGALLLVSRMRQGRVERDRDPQNNRYLASRAVVANELSGKAVKKRSWLRPGITVKQPSQVAWCVGVSRGVKAWIPYEESIVVAAPARTGKGRYIVTPAIAEFDGPVISTSTRAENLIDTYAERAARGPIGVFAPLGLGQGRLPRGVGTKLVGFDLTGGCTDMEVAKRRAGILASGQAGGVKDQDFWEGRGKALLTPLLMAGDISGEGVDGLVRWARDPAIARTALEILDNHGSADAAIAADELRAIVDGEDWKTVSNQWMMVRRAVDPLDIPHVREALKTTTFTINDFLENSGTFYIVLPEAGLIGALGSVILEEFYLAAARKAETCIGGRLEPPLHFSLDEIANIGRPPSLLTMATAGGGSGIQTMIALQSLEQARQAWGSQYANAIWDATTTKIVLGGVTDTKLLEDISVLAGEHDASATNASYRSMSLLADSFSTHTTRRRNLTVENLRSLPAGRAVLVRKATPVAPLTLATLDERVRWRK
ncbi:type IV secretory system conjugative DNA transfer family protein [Trueperella pyogenes]|uniref:type IV secretory system conjugative DNA transfer family protein n=1 Tax=Trueperella pyogenes TaxID=1661 RepID=UPI00345DB0C0